MPVSAETIRYRTSQKSADYKIKIKVEQVSFEYSGRQILRGMDLTIAPGEFVVLMGPSGCGKSTFLRLVSGLDIPHQGRIRIDEKTVTGPSPERAVVFQDYSLFPWLTARENIVIALRQRFPGRKGKELRELADHYLELVQLGRAGHLYPGQLSGGMRQRIAIARALAVGTDVLLMDEPFGALDPLTRVHLQDLLLRIVEDRDVTILFVTHDVDEALYLADRVVVFSPGPPSEIADVLELPFPRPRNRKQLAERMEYNVLRDRILTMMNRGLLSKLEEEGMFEPGGSGI
ncbi:MAG: ABC transporter ATP-binding protein [Kyrpidia sp.]|nr:ABC transporter ATP-binding protein [Kyrpidia sp.]